MAFQMLFPWPVTLLASLLLLTCCSQHPAASPEQASSTSPPSSHAATTGASGNVTCFVIRTYYGHGDAKGSGALRAIIHSLQAQTSPR